MSSSFQKLFGKAPAKSIDPVEPADLFDPVEPVEPVELAEPVEPAEPAKPKCPNTISGTSFDLDQLREILGALPERDLKESPIYKFYSAVEEERQAVGKFTSGVGFGNVVFPLVDIPFTHRLPGYDLSQVDSRDDNLADEGTNDHHSTSRLAILSPLHQYAIQYLIMLDDLCKSVSSSFSSQSVLVDMLSNLPKACETDPDRYYHSYLGLGERDVFYMNTGYIADNINFLALWITQVREKYSNLVEGRNELVSQVAAGIEALSPSKAPEVSAYEELKQLRSLGAALLVASRTVGAKYQPAIEFTISLKQTAIDAMHYCFVVRDGKNDHFENKTDNQYALALCGKAKMPLPDFAPSAGIGEKSQSDSLMPEKVSDPSGSSESGSSYRSLTKAELAAGEMNEDEDEDDVPPPAYTERSDDGSVQQ